MGDAGGQLADRFHLLHLAKRHLRFLAPAHLRRECDSALRDARLELLIGPLQGFLVALADTDILDRPENAGHGASGIAHRRRPVLDVDQLTVAAKGAHGHMRNFKACHGLVADLFEDMPVVGMNEFKRIAQGRREAIGRQAENAVDAIRPDQLAGAAVDLVVAEQRHAFGAFEIGVTFVDDRFGALERRYILQRAELADS